MPSSESRRSLTPGRESSRSLRSNRESTKSNRRYIAEEIMAEEHDSLCLLPSSMRCLCMTLTCLLILSLGAAIFNSLQAASNGSKSYCKPHKDLFSPQYLCPKETMLIYFACCIDESTMTVRCCKQIKIWLLFAFICVGCSIVIGIIYAILNISRRLRKRSPSLSES